MATGCKRRFCFREFILDEGSRSLCSNGSFISLAPKEFDALLLLVEAAGQVVGKEDLMTAVWPGTFVGENSLTKNISVLRKRLGTDAIETLPKHGYRFAWEVVDVSRDVSHIEQNPVPQFAAQVAAMPAELAPVSHILRDERHLPVKLMVLGILSAATLIGAGWTVWRTYSRVADREPVIRIAVLPFRNLSEVPNTDYLRDGITEELITSLGQINPERIQVLAHNSSAVYLNTTKPAAVVARELGVQFLVEGSIQSFNSKLECIVHLVRGSDGTVLWSSRLVRSRPKLSAIQAEIADAVGREIEVKMVSREAGNIGADTLDPLAHDAYLHGLADLEQRTFPAFEDALAQFKNATTLDPGYARAWAGLADVYTLMTGRVRQTTALANVKQYARHAIELNPRLSAPHRDLGFALFNDDADLDGAEREYRQALRLNPSDSLAHYDYAQLLMAELRKEEALREARDGLALDPLSLASNYNYAFMLIDAGQAQAGIDRLYELTTRVPDNEAVFGYIGLGYLRLHRYAKAAQAFERARELDGTGYNYQAAVAYCLAKNGDLLSARKLIGDLVRRSKQGTWITSADLIFGYLGLGDRDRALYWLQKAVERHETTLLEVNYEPFSELAVDSRFDKITCPLRGKNDPCTARVK